MRKLIFTSLVILAFACEALTQTDKNIPAILGVGVAFGGKIKSDTVSWADNTIGGTVYAQIPDAFATLVELTALTRSNATSPVGFKYYFSAKLGGGVVLLRKKRLNFPLYLNIGYAYTVADNATKNFGGVALGYKVGINYFVTQKMSIALRYCYDFNVTEKVDFSGFPEIEDFTYSTNYISLGLGFSIFEKTKSPITKNY